MFLAVASEDLERFFILGLVSIPGTGLVFVRLFRFSFCVWPALPSSGFVSIGMERTCFWSWPWSLRYTLTNPSIPTVAQNRVMK